MRFGSILTGSEKMWSFVQFRFPKAALFAVLVLIAVSCQDDPLPESKSQFAAPSTTSPTVISPTGRTLPDEIAAQLLTDLVSSNDEKIDAALDRIVEAHDQRFTSVIVELLRAREIGLILGDSSRFVAVLQTLSGQSIVANWAAWSEWYLRHGSCPSARLCNLERELVGYY